MRILLSVEESAGIQAIRAASNSDHEIVAVLTSMGGATGGRLGATVEGTAAHFGYPVWPAEQVKDSAFAAIVRQESVELLLNVHSLHVVHEQVLSAVRVGAFNLHPGPLPRYAGMNAPSWAIMNGEPRHGVTLHWMESGIDTGPIAYQSMFDLTPNDTALSISSRCSRLGLKLIEDLVRAEPAAIPRRRQDFSERRYHGFKVPFEGRVPWHSAELVERFIRACNFYPLPSPWGVPTLRYRGEELGMIEVSVTNQQCTAPAETVEFRQNKCYVAADDYWLQLKRVLHKSKLVNASELPR
jgi:methionyl-tRNA formyltransferase